jgi:peptidoglycan lytic transglycosylase G
MTAYVHPQRLGRSRVPRRVWLLLVVLILIIVVGAFWARRVYTADLQAVSNSPKTEIVTIQSGSTVKQIGDQLESAHLIRSAWAFDLYIHSKDVNNELQAGTYALAPDQTMSDIVSTLTKGKIETSVVTILPGRRIDQVRADLINDGYSPSAVDSALDPAQYADVPALAFKPTDIDSLEGLLWPDSFDKDPTTPPSTIIRESLVEMGQQLTPNVQAAFTAEGLTTYQGLILASIIEQEVSKPSDQAQAAQVFLSRLKAGMMLGSDVTANYGAIVAGQPPSLSYSSAYNTLQNTGLPPTPISTINSSALYAATHPAATDWLYFVTGDDGTTYFSTTLQQQQANTQQYCHKLCQ